MTKKSIITVSQLFCILFVSRLIIHLTYNPTMAFSDSMWDHLVSAFLSFLITFILYVPIYKLYKVRPDMNVADNCYYLLGKLGFILVSIYAIYYLFICVHTLSLFNIFVANVMSPKVSLFVLSFAVTLVSCYGAYKGLEGLVRSAGIILFLICISIIFLVIALVPSISTLNYIPLMYNGPEQAINGTLLMLSKSSSLAAMAMLLPLVKGNVKKGMIFLNIAIYLSISLFILLIVGALGDYLKIHIFPVYAATSMAQLGMFKRLNALYIGIWTTGLFIKISLFIFLFSMMIKRIFGDKSGRRAILIAGFIVSILSIVVAVSRELSYMVYNIYWVLGFTLLVGFIIPLFLLIIDYIKTKVRRSSV